jgi:uncharacterized protein
MARVTFLLALLLCLAAGPAAAQALPDLTAPVNDFAKVIDAPSAAALEQRIRALQGATGDAVVVVTVQTFAPYATIDEFAARLFEKSTVGEKTKDNGALIVLALAERRVRIEVGYGLEEFVPDGYAGDVIRQAMLPDFRNGNFGAGLLAGTTRVIQRIAERRGVTLADIPKVSDQTPGQPGQRRPIGFVGILLILLFFFIAGRMRGRSSGIHRRGGPFGGSTWSGWSGGGGGFGGGFGGGGGGGFGGFGGFGGGRSGGGGASGGF